MRSNPHISVYRAHYVFHPLISSPPVSAAGKPCTTAIVLSDYPVWWRRGRWAAGGWRSNVVVVRVNHNTIVYQYRSCTQHPCTVPAHYTHSVIQCRPISRRLWSLTEKKCVSAPFSPCVHRYGPSPPRGNPADRVPQPALCLVDTV